MSSLQIHQLFDTVSSTFTYILADEATSEAILIDTVDEQHERDVAFLKDKGLTLKYAIETHAHADHITGAGLLRDKLKCAAAVPAGEGISNADLQLKHNDLLHFGSHTLRAMATPGHTSGSMSFACDDNLFTGDALFIGGCGRTDFQGGDAGTLYDSIQNNFFSLPDQTVIWPGHDYKELHKMADATCWLDASLPSLWHALNHISLSSLYILDLNTYETTLLLSFYVVQLCLIGNKSTTVGQEKSTNPRLAGKTREEFIAIMNGLNLPMPKLIHVAVPANLKLGQKV